MRLALALLLAAAGDDEAWVSQWLAGEAPAPGLMAGFHRQFPASPHAEASRTYEALQRTRRVGADGAAAGRLEVRALEQLSDPKADAEAHERAAKVLGWLQQPAAIPGLQKAGQDGTLEAVRALGFFGAVGKRDWYFVFGGTPVAEEFPPRPDARATEALLALSHHADAEVRREALAALELHDGTEVDRAWQQAARACLDARAIRRLETQPMAGRVEVLARCASAQIADSVRAAALHALGAVGAREQIPLLLAALDDGSPEVFLAAHRALSRLEGFEGEPPDESVRDRALLVPLWRKRLGTR